MSDIFVGAEQTRTYTAPGVRENSCMAVNLAMLGVGTIEDCDTALVGSGISTPDGVSTMPEEGTELDVHGNKVTLGEIQMWLDPESAIEDARTQFALGKAVIAAVKLNEKNPDDDAIHLILLAGQFTQDGEPGDILVGDSLRDGMQREPAAAVAARLERTIEWAGALFSYHVSVVLDPEE